MYVYCWRRENLGRACKDCVIFSNFVKTYVVCTIWEIQVLIRCFSLNVRTSLDMLSLLWTMNIWLPSGVLFTSLWVDYFWAFSGLLPFWRGLHFFLLTYCFQTYERSTSRNLLKSYILCTSLRLFLSMHLAWIYASNSPFTVLWRLA